MDNKERLTVLGKRFREEREKRNMSQTELANTIGKDQPSINRLERGNINPSYLYMCEVCEGLGVCLCDLLKGI